jgi:hypothetical protein
MDIGDIFHLLRLLAWKYATDILSLLGYRARMSEIHILSLRSSLGFRHENHILNYRKKIWGS